MRNKKCLLVIRSYLEVYERRGKAIQRAVGNPGLGVPFTELRFLKFLMDIRVVK